MTAGIHVIVFCDEERSIPMKKGGKIALIVFSGLPFLSLIFWRAWFYLDGCSHLYYSQNVVNSIFVFFAIAILALLVFSAMAVMLFKCGKVIRVICTVLLAVSIPVTLFGSFLQMAFLALFGPIGCSYTEDIANYGTYDRGYDPAYFPDAITEDMTVVDFAYFYKYVDVDQVDIYLEVKFDDEETMERYLTAAKNAISTQDGILTYPNPYDPKYTDVVGNSWVVDSGQGTFASSIQFDGDDAYRYVEMNHYAVTYSYDELTVIYNYTYIGSDIEVGNDPDRGAYYPKYLERFGVEWDPANGFAYDYVEK